MTGLEQQAHLLMAEGYVRLGYYYDVMDCYRHAGLPVPNEVLIACGERALELGSHTNATLAFEEAKAGLSTRQIIACGDVAMANGDLSEAMMAYDEAKHTEGLLAVGTLYLADDNLKEAEWAFESAGVEMPKLTRRRLIAIGKRALARGHDDRAHYAFEKADYEEGLASIRERNSVQSPRKLTPGGRERREALLSAVEAAKDERSKEKLQALATESVQGRQNKPAFAAFKAILELESGQTGQ